MQVLWQAGAAGAFGAGIGAIAGAIAGNLRGLQGAIATAQLQKLEIALQGILGSRTEEALRVIDQAARDFNQPIADATRNFTQLSAAATANGNSVERSRTFIEDCLLLLRPPAAMPRS